MRDKFSIYEPRNDSNQSPTHFTGSTAALREKMRRLRNWRTRSIWIDLKVSIKRIYSRSNTRVYARQEFLRDGPRISLRFVRSRTILSLYGRD